MPSNPIETNVGASIVRTISPFLTAYVVAYLAKNGFTVDNEEINAQVVTALGSVWYAIVRALEQRWPKAGWLLGAPKQPDYGKDS